MLPRRRPAQEVEDAAFGNETVKVLFAATLAGAVGVVALPVLVVLLVTAALTGGASGSAPAPSGAADGGARGEVAAAWALGELGVPYRWGGTGPDTFDCSGLVLRAWQAAGVHVPRVAADQYGAGPHVPVGAARPGDLVFFATDPADPTTIIHVGISVGGGLMVDAPFTGAVVRIDRATGAGLVPRATRPG